MFIYEESYINKKLSTAKKGMFENKEKTLNLKKKGKNIISQQDYNILCNKMTSLDFWKFQHFLK